MVEAALKAGTGRCAIAQELYTLDQRVAENQRRWYSTERSILPFGLEAAREQGHKLKSW